MKGEAVHGCKFLFVIHLELLSNLHGIMRKILLKAKGGISAELIFEVHPFALVEE